MTIPITVFTGFLGAGKTSIILSLLPRLPKDYSVVLLKNEFGDVEGELEIDPNGGEQLTVFQSIANSQKLQTLQQRRATRRRRRA